MLFLLAYLMTSAATAQQADTPIVWSDLTLQSVDGISVDASKLNGKAVLVVNVASKCGFTGQYEGLQTLYKEHKDSGFEIVGVPCNQFGWQEPAGNAEIASFCRMTYGVEFTMLEKQDVNGSDRSDLYAGLVQSSAGNGRAIRWNFEKFLVGRDGLVKQRFGSATGPGDAGLVGAIRAAIDAPAPKPAQ
jgi:glutathione peroxidase